MFQFSFKKATVFLLIFSLVCIQIIPALADSKKINVAFLGIQFEGMPKDIQERILERFEDLLKAESSFQVRGQDNVEESLGSERIRSVLTALETTDFAGLADELQANYIYGGRLSNNSREGKKILLEGELYRYDRGSNLRHKFQVLKYYDNFGVELVKFKQEFVKTIVPGQKKGPKILPFLVLGGIAVAGILSFIFVNASGGASGGGPPSDPDPPK